MSCMPPSLAFLSMVRTGLLRSLRVVSRAGEGVEVVVLLDLSDVFEEEGVVGREGIGDDALLEGEALGGRDDEGLLLLLLLLLG